MRQLKEEEVDDFQALEAIDRFLHDRSKINIGRVLYLTKCIYHYLTEYHTTNS